MLRELRAWCLGKLAILLFLAEFIGLLSLSLYKKVGWAAIRGYVVHRTKPYLARLDALEHDRRHAAARWVTGWARHILWWTRRLMRIQVTVNMPPTLIHPGEQFILMGNHESSYDAVLYPALAGELNLSPTWAVKAILYKVPLIGPAMRWCGSAKLQRSGVKQDRPRMWVCARRAARYGMSIGILPEGTRRGKNRTADQRVGKVNPGGFLAAVNAAPHYRILVLCVDRVGNHARTILDAGALYGSEITVDAEIHDSVAHLSKEEQVAWLFALFERMNTKLVRRHRQRAQRQDVLVQVE